MRLPLQHEPYWQDATRQHCVYLEELARASIGLPLGPAADLLSSPNSRGRYGNALQWHLGLKPHDGLAVRDWEDRIEIKLVSLWIRKNGQISCDKIKVCDAHIDPWRKLANVLWVFVDRVTRVIVDYRFWHCAGEGRALLEAAWTMDPHFENPSLFIEARETNTTFAPAYYIAANWFAQTKILPEKTPSTGIYPLDGVWWSKARRMNGQYKDPLIALWRGTKGESMACPRCSGVLLFSEETVRSQGWSPATHTMPLGPQCALRSHILINENRLILQAEHPGRKELEQALEGQVQPSFVWRLADRVMEPEDHFH